MRPCVIFCLSSFCIQTTAISHAEHEASWRMPEDLPLFSSTTLSMPMLNKHNGKTINYYLMKASPRTIRAIKGHLLSWPYTTSSVKGAHSNLRTNLLWVDLLEKVRKPNELQSSPLVCTRKKSANWNNIYLECTWATSKSRMVRPYWLTTALHSWLTTSLAPMAWFILVIAVFIYAYREIYR